MHTQFHVVAEARSCVQITKDFKDIEVIVTWWLEELPGTFFYDPIQDLEMTANTWAAQLCS